MLTIKIGMRNKIMNVISTISIIFLVMLLISVLFLPILQISGHSMYPSLREGDIVLSIEGGSIIERDIIAFKYSEKVIIKRVIARAGQYIEINKDGEVLINGELIEENYLENCVRGECDIKFPFLVPESKLFVMGDNRGVSVDSRSKRIGCVEEDMVMGRVVFRIWPLERFGFID